MSGGNGRPRQERDLLPGRSAALWVGGTGLAVVLVAVLSWALLRAFEEGPLESGSTGGTGAARPPPVPYGRMVRPAAPDSATRARLESYLWIDPERGVVQVPVRKAMEILVRTRAPGGPSPDSAPPATPEGGAPRGEEAGTTAPAPGRRP